MDFNPFDNITVGGSSHPNKAYQFIPYTYTINVIDSDPIQNILWTFNGNVVKNQYLGVANNIMSGIFNYTTTYNSIGNVIISVSVNDSYDLLDSNSSTVLYRQYVLPSIATLLPTVTAAEFAYNFQRSNDTTKLPCQ